MQKGLRPRVVSHQDKGAQESGTGGGRRAVARGQRDRAQRLAGFQHVSRGDRGEPHGHCPASGRPGQGLVFPVDAGREALGVAANLLVCGEQCACLGAGIGACRARGKSAHFHGVLAFLLGGPGDSLGEGIYLGLEPGARSPRFTQFFGAERFEALDCVVEKPRRAACGG